MHNACTEEKRLKNLQLEQKRLVVEFVNSDLEFHSVQMSIESVQEGIAVEGFTDFIHIN